LIFLSGIKINSHDYAFNPYAFSHTIEEEEKLHGEDYGYFLGDDVSHPH
jgi:hypothetical protein